MTDRLQRALALIDTANAADPKGAALVYGQRMTDELARLFPGAHHAFDGLSGGVRQRVLPDGRTVSFGPDGAARAESRRLVMEFLAGLP